MPQIGAPEGEAVGQTVFYGGLFCQGNGRCLDVDAGDAEIRLPLQKQQSQQPGAAAQVADPQPGGKTGQRGEKKGIRAGTE